MATHDNVRCTIMSFARTCGASAEEDRGAGLDSEGYVSVDYMIAKGGTMSDEQGKERTDNENVRDRESVVLTTKSDGFADTSDSVEPVSKLTIRGQGLSFEREVPDSLVLRIMKLVLTGEGAPEPWETGAIAGRSSPSGDGRKESLAEFYRRANPTKYPEKLTTIGAYLQMTLEKKSFTPDDLRAQFRAVNEGLPANMSRDFRVAVGEGWIAEEHDEPGQFFVTRSGLDTVEGAFGTVGRKATRARRRRKTKGESATDNVNTSE
jgi:hypothetical protein